MAADFLDDKRNEIKARLNELRPIVAEYHRLQAAADALDGVTAKPTGGGTGATRRATGARRGRPRGTGKRGDQALALVRATPGITVTQLAETMGIGKNYLYRLLPGLANDGLVTKKGRGWHPKQAV
jgi:hypothetical protein